MTDHADDLDDAVSLVHKAWKDARDHSSEWRTEAEEAYDMIAGRQWASEDKKTLEDQQRVPTVFNFVARVLNTIVGTQVANRQETRFIPREMGDVQVNEVLTAASEWVRDQCDAEDEESDAFGDLCTCGMGWTETRLDYESDPDGTVKVERVDPFEMYWDPAARKRNLSDARWVMQVKRMSSEEFEREWPDADMGLVGAPWEEPTDAITTHDWVPPQDAYKDRQAGGPTAKKLIRVAHFQWAERTAAYRVGKKAERLSEKKFKKLKPKLDADKIAYARQPEVKWKRAFVAGNELLEEGDCPFPDGSTYRCMTGARDRNKNLFYGVVRAMVDPQRFGNKFFSLILDIIAKGAKGGVMIEADATDDIRDLEEKWARPDAVHKFRPGALAGGKVVPKPQVMWPAGLDRMMTFSLDAVHQVTGVNLELLGLAEREQAGVLEAQRKQAGLTILAPLFDAMRRYRKEQGRVMLHFIQTYLSDGRLIRVVGKNGQEQYVPLAKQPETAKYDVIVDEAPTSPNMKERVFGALVQMFPVLAKAGIPLPPELLDYAPIPSGLAQKWKELIQSSGGDPQAARTQLEQMGQAMQRLAQENRALKDKREETAANLQMQGQKQQAETQLKAEAQAAELQFAAAEHQARLMQMQRETELKQAELAHKLQLAEAELRTNLTINAARADAAIRDSKAKAQARPQ